MQPLFNHLATRRVVDQRLGKQRISPESWRDELLYER